MFVRLLLTLLLAVFAVPEAQAMAACHDAPARAMALEMAMPGDHPAPHEKSQPAGHLCAGCIPPADWLRERIAARFVPASRPVAPAIAALDLGGAIPPALPPPRHG